MFSPLSFRLCRRFALYLALTAILATLATPLQASPLDRAPAKNPVVALLDWLQGLLSSFGIDTEADEGASDGPAAAFLPEGGCIDPNGVPIACPKTTAVDLTIQSKKGGSGAGGEYRMR